MSVIGNASEWRRFAQMDYDLAMHAFLHMHPKPLELICYHCHQAVEKLLKSYMIAMGDDPPMTHDLRLLCKLCMNDAERFADLAQTCNLLTNYGVQPRYPNDMELTEGDTELALRRAETVFSFCDSIISEMDKEASHAPANQ